MTGGRLLALHGNVEAVVGVVPLVAPAAVHVERPQVGVRAQARPRKQCSGSSGEVRHADVDELAMPASADASPRLRVQGVCVTCGDW